MRAKYAPIINAVEMAQKLDLRKVALIEVSDAWHNGTQCALYRRVGSDNRTMEHGASYASACISGVPDNEVEETELATYIVAKLIPENWQNYGKITLYVTTIGGKKIEISNK